MGINTDAEPAAWLGGWLATGLEEVSSDPASLESSGRWAVVLPYAAPPVLARFGSWQECRPDQVVAGQWHGPRPGAWVSSMDREAYVAAVGDVRDEIARGEVYQANVCRVMRAALPDSHSADVAGLHALLSAGNPSPHGGFVRLPGQGIQVATASPELFLRRDGDRVVSGPIKGTGRVAADLREKDVAENVMIVDLVRNDLARACVPGSIAVPALLALEEHPGLVHLVSRVSGLLVPGHGWPELIDAAFPPGSVTGAPKSSALRIIDRLEPAPRGIYCGAVGWVDADTGAGELAVAIRTFWLEGEEVLFGTGAGITWGSDPDAEWDETELKAARLVAVASGTWPPAAADRPGFPVAGAGAAAGVGQ